MLVQKGFLGQEHPVPPGVPAIDLKSDFLSSGEPFERAVDGADISDIIYTSGTTGRPKGAMMNHRQTLRMYEEWATLADLREGDRYLMINPYFHTFGLKAGLIASFLRGATMLPVDVFDVDRVVELIDAERITMLPGPPTLYHSLLAVARQEQAGDAAGRCHRRRGHPRGAGSPDTAGASVPDTDDGIRADRGRQCDAVSAG